MADKIRRQALTVQENEELAEVIRKYPCLYDKSKKEHKDKNVTENAWKEVAELRFFFKHSKVKKITAEKYKVVWKCINSR